MKNLILLSVLGLLFSTNLFSQWQPTGAIEGADISSLALAGSKIYACANYPGFYYSTNYGSSWIQTNNHFPSDTSCLTSIGTKVIAGNRNGIYISNDDGSNWSSSNNGLPSNPKIFCLRSAGDSIYAGTTDGLYISNDSGATWLNSGLTGSHVLSFAFSGSIIYAVDSFAVYRSLNHGATWTQQFTHSNSNFTRIEAGISLVYASTYQSEIFKSTNSGVSWTLAGYGSRANCMLLFGQNIYDGAYGGLSRSTNGGASWQSINDFAYRNVTSIITDGTYIFASCDDGYQSTQHRGGGFFISTDNGNAWIMRNSGMINPVILSFASTGAEILCGTDDGIYKSGNSGTIWNNISPAPHSQMECGNQNVIFAWSSNTAIYRSTNTGNTWDSLTAGQTYCSHYYFAGNNMLAGGGAGPLGGPIIATSTDNGSTWMSTFYSLDDNAYSFACNGTITYAAAYYELVASTDYGLTWPVTISSTLSDMYDMVATGSRIFGSTHNNGASNQMHISTDNGQTWYYSSPGIPSLEMVNSIVCDSLNVYVSTKSGVYCSTDDGVSWCSMNAGLPQNKRISGLLLDNSTLYCAMDGIGVWRTSVNTGINSTYKGDLSVSVYPNPAGSYINIEYTSTEKTIISVFDATGRMCLPISTKASGMVKQKLNVSSLEPGIYFIEVKSVNFTYRNKVYLIK